MSRHPSLTVLLLSALLGLSGLATARDLEAIASLRTQQRENQRFCMDVPVSPAHARSSRAARPVPSIVGSTGRAVPSRQVARASLMHPDEDPQIRPAVCVGRYSMPTAPAPQGFVRVRGIRAALHPKHGRRGPPQGTARPAPITLVDASRVTVGRHELLVVG
jgi:hypothetical protein